MQRLSILLRQAPMVLRPHPAFLAINAALLSLNAPGFAASHLPALRAASDSRLLVIFPLLNVMVVLTRRRSRLRRKRKRCNRNCRGKKNRFHIHRLLLTRRLLLRRTTNTEDTHSRKLLRLPKYFIFRLISFHAPPGHHPCGHTYAHPLLRRRI